MRRSRRPKLIYDSHEFEAGRARDRSRLMRWFVVLLERFLIRKCAFVIVVNDSIADALQDLHGLKQRPTVIRSIPEKWEINEERIIETRKDLCREKEWDEDTFILMYHGMLSEERNVIGFIDILVRNPKICGVLVGDFASEEFEKRTRDYIRQRGVESRIYIHRAVPIAELYRYIGVADLETILLLPKYRSYYLCLPNKFFESIHALTPLLTSDFPEMKQLIERFQIGAYVDPENSEAIDNTVYRFYNSKQEDKRLLKHNLQKAKEELCWENEKERLRKSFIGIV